MPKFPFVTFALTSFLVVIGVVAAIQENYFLMGGAYVSALMVGAVALRGMRKFRLERDARSRERGSVNIPVIVFTLVVIATFFIGVLITQQGLIGYIILALLLAAETLAIWLYEKRRRQ